MVIVKVPPCKSSMVILPLRAFSPSSPIFFSKRFLFSREIVPKTILSIEFDKNELGEQELKKAVNEMSNKVLKLSDGVRKNLLLQYANPIIQKQNLV